MRCARCSVVGVVELIGSCDATHQNMNGGAPEKAQSKAELGDA